MSKPTQHRLKQLFYYNSRTGLFTRRKPKPHLKRYAGTIRSTDGRRQISVDNKTYLASHLAWVYMTGSWPSRLVDHEDTERSNDAWSNLRLATYSQQMWNQNKRVNNTSGYKGVCWDKRLKKYRASVAIRYKKHNLGLFSTKRKAFAAYCSAVKDLHGSFARTT